MPRLIYTDGTEYFQTSVYIRADLYAFSQREKLNNTRILNEALEAKMGAMEAVTPKPAPPRDEVKEDKRVETSKEAEEVKKDGKKHVAFEKVEEKEVETWSQVLLL